MNQNRVLLYEHGTRERCVGVCVSSGSNLYKKIQEPDNRPHEITWSKNGEFATIDRAYGYDFNSESMFLLSSTTAFDKAMDERGGLGPTIPISQLEWIKPEYKYWDNIYSCSEDEQEDQCSSME